MAGYVRESIGHKQMMIGRISKDLVAIASASPETMKEVLQLSKDISLIINEYVLNDETNRTKNLFESRLKSIYGV